MGRRRCEQAQFHAKRITLTRLKTRRGYTGKPLQGIRIYLAGVLRRRRMGLIRHDLAPMLLAASLLPLEPAVRLRETEPSPVTVMLFPLRLHTLPPDRVVGRRSVSRRLGAIGRECAEDT